MDDKNNESKPSPREALITSELLGFEIAKAGNEASEAGLEIAKTSMAKTGKSLPQPTWAR